MTGSFQGFRHVQGDGLGAGEDDHTFTSDRLKNAIERFEFVTVLKGDAALANPASFFLLGFDRDFCRLTQVALGQPANLRRHRRGEEHDLALFWQLIKDPFDIVDEAHAQHFIGFIKHQAAETGGVQCPLAHVVHHPPRGTHHHIHTTFQGMDL